MKKLSMLALGLVLSFTAAQAQTVKENAKETAHQAGQTADAAANLFILILSSLDGLQSHISVVSSF